MTTLRVDRAHIDFAAKTLLPDYVARLDACIRTGSDGLLDRDSITLFESDDGAEFYAQFDCNARPACLEEFAPIPEDAMLPCHILD